MISKLLLLLSFSMFYSQDSLTVIPGLHYKSSADYEYFMGKHWRDIWTSEIKVEVLNLKEYAGGLKPIKLGGGFQTKSLRFVSKNGRLYKFRSLDKDPKKVLPEELQTTFIAEVVQDQISTSHPMSAIITSELLDAAGIINAKPILVILPDDPILGIYQKEFANLLGTLEEHPDEYEDKRLNFSAADKLIKSYNLFEKLQTKQTHHVDQFEYLKARLMDIILGDWDRHEDQWRWAGYKKGENWAWKPIPRDRDQAFSLYDGVLPYIGTIAVPQIESFEEDYPIIQMLTWSGRHTDRRFLNQITKAQWDSITVDIKNILSDELIEKSVKMMPQNWYDISADYIRKALQNRRENLLEASNDFYMNTVKYSTIFGTDKREIAEVHRLNDSTVDVTIYRLSKKGNKKEKLFFRRYYKNETKEIRILLDKGDDEAIITGRVDESIDVIIDGGKGKDVLTDKSIVDGNFLYITPFSDSETKTFFYDNGKKTKFTKSSSTGINKHRYNKPDSLSDKFEPKYRDYGHEWIVEPKLSYNSDDGFIFGLGPVLYSYGYLADPYYYRMSLVPSYSTTADAYQIEYKSSFLDVFYNTELTLDLNFTEFDINRFYGFGNNSKLDFDEDDSFYQVGNQRFEIRSNLLFNDKKWVTKFGASWLHSKIEEFPNTLLDTLNIRGEGISQLSGFHTGFGYKNVKEKNEFYKHGFSFHVEFGIYPKLINDDYRFEEFNFEFKTYYPISENFIQATRIYVDIKSGKIPFFKSAFLGHNQLLRGFTKDRFSGKSLIVGNYEIRSYLTNMKILIPTKIGYNVFADFGRVYFDNEKSNKIHKSLGAGIWISIMDNLALINLTVAGSTESTELNLTTSFSF